MKDNIRTPEVKTKVYHPVHNPSRTYPDIHSKVPSHLNLTVFIKPFPRSSQPTHTEIQQDLPYFIDSLLLVFLIRHAYKSD